MSSTETLVRISGQDWTYVVNVDGLDTLMRFLRDSDPDMRAAMRQGLKDSANPVLARARTNAYRIADDGTFAHSMSIRSYASGSVVLHSSDVAAGVKEFARPGAVTRTSKGTPLANARLRKKSRVGVPRRANAPRAMVPAINDSVDEVASRIDARLSEALRQVENG